MTVTRSTSHAPLRSHAAAESRARHGGAKPGKRRTSNIQRPTSNERTSALPAPRSPLDGRYPGGKNGAGTWQWLLDLMPTHARYAEPFAGSAALARRKTPALETVLIDTSLRQFHWLQSLDLPGATVIRGDGLFWLLEEAKAWDRDCLVYCDPPYMHEARVKVRVYEHEWDTPRHRLLMRAVNKLDCHVMVSGYRTALYDRSLSNWHRRARYVVTRGGTTRQECCWCNFDPDDRSLYSPFSAVAGKDYRERERIKRKAARWARMLSDMPPAERAAVLTATLAAYAKGNR